MVSRFLAIGAQGKQGYVHSSYAKLITSDVSPSKCALAQEQSVAIRRLEEKEFAFNRELDQWLDRNKTYEEVRSWALVPSLADMHAIVRYRYELPVLKMATGRQRCISKLSEDERNTVLWKGKGRESEIEDEYSILSSRRQPERLKPKSLSFNRAVTCGILEVRLEGDRSVVSWSPRKRGDQEMLFEIILAANYLDIKALLDVGCKTVANMIKGKSPDEIRKTFNIGNNNTHIRVYCR
ncbi:hypothetical protein P3342_006786 [Pyrenophora teres f. teres]|nr:hypothetical protein P3342_006786 [Pyrenophora teres f. teres]